MSSIKRTIYKIETSVLKFAKKNIVMTIAFLAAVMTSFVIPIDKEYIGYFDFKTLTCLFCVLAVVCALKNFKSSVPTLNSYSFPY